METDRKQLLLAEDDMMLASLIRFRLEKEGYEVLLAQDGLEVKELLKKGMPHIIVSDIMMPYFSGIEIIDHLRNQLQSQVPVIIISTAGNEENVLSAFELGANDFISKPFSPSELLVRVGRELKKL
jgi:DNA-binding response OmpR family regulator